MCKSCTGLIFDILARPLDAQHPMRKHIHEKSLNVCASEISPLLYKLIEGLPTAIHFLSTVPEQDAVKDPFLREFLYCQGVYLKYLEMFPEAFQECSSATLRLVELGVIRKTDKHLAVAHEFFVLKFRDILMLVPECHFGHLKRESPEDQKSSGMVPPWKINAVRARYNLPPCFILPPAPLEEIVVETIGGGLGGLCIKVPIEDESLYW